MAFREFTDLMRPQWVAVLAHLKRGGGMAVTEIAAGVGASYMAVKQHCEELHGMGYLHRSRVPRKEVGRPEIFYSLSERAEGLFPDVGVDFTLELLVEMKGLFGENTPEKLLFQYFQKLEVKWLNALRGASDLREKVVRLVSLREQLGGRVQLGVSENGELWFEEFHNPLRRLFESYPRAVAMELRLLEQVLGVRLTRREVSSGRGAAPRVIFEMDGPVI